MPRHAAPANPRRRLYAIAGVWALSLVVVGSFTAYAAAAGGQVTCAPGADLLVHGDGTWTCGPEPAPSATPSPSGSPTASPSPTVTTTPPSPTNPPTTTTAPATSPPAPSPTGTLRNCLAQLAACGYPNDLNTGPSGPLTISTRTQYANAGETISGVDIRGCVEVRAQNVTFRNVKISGSCFYAVRNFSSGLRIEDSELSCNGSNGTGVASTNYSLLRVDIHGCENGLDVGGNVSLVDSWIHDMVTCCGAHTDGAQINQGATNITIRHNTIIIPAPGGTSAIISWDENDPQQQNVAIDANLLSGGTYTLYCPRQGPSDTRVTNNRFAAYQYGSTNSCVGNHVSVWSGNVLDLDGTTLGAT